MVSITGTFTVIAINLLALFLLFYFGAISTDHIDHVANHTRDSYVPKSKRGFLYNTCATTKRLLMSCFGWMDMRVSSMNTSSIQRARYRQADTLA